MHCIDLIADSFGLANTVHAKELGFKNLLSGSSSNQKIDQ